MQFCCLPLALIDLHEPEVIHREYANGHARKVVLDNQAHAYGHERKVVEQTHTYGQAYGQERKVVKQTHTYGQERKVVYQAHAYGHERKIIKQSHTYGQAYGQERKVVYQAHAYGHEHKVVNQKHKYIDMLGSPVETDAGTSYAYSRKNTKNETVSDSGSENENSTSVIRLSFDHDSDTSSDLLSFNGDSDDSDIFAEYLEGRRALVSPESSSSSAEQITLFKLDTISSESSDQDELVQQWI